MAERRMLHKKASVSSDLAALRDKQGPDAALFFVLMIPHFDRWGCVPDDAGALRASIIPRFEGVTDKDVKRWVDWMVKRGMLARITGPNGDRGLQSPDFHEHQRTAPLEREAPSPYEPTSVTEKWAKKPRNAGRSVSSQRVVTEESVRSHKKGMERKGREVIPSPSFHSGEGGVGEGQDGPVGSAGRGQPPGPAFVIDEEAESAASIAALREQFASSELTRPFLKILGGEDG